MVSPLEAVDTTDAKRKKLLPPELNMTIGATWFPCTEGETDHFVGPLSLR
jgi:hypothetical protein